MKINKEKFYKLLSEAKNYAEDIKRTSDQRYDEGYLQALNDVLFLCIEKTEA